MSRHRVVVLGSVSDYEHFRVGSVPLHLFSGQAALRAATSVVSPVLMGEKEVNQSERLVFWLLNFPIWANTYE